MSVESAYKPRLSRFCLLCNCAVTVYLCICTFIYSCIQADFVNGPVVLSLHVNKLDLIALNCRYSHKQIISIILQFNNSKIIYAVCYLMHFSLIFCLYVFVYRLLFDAFCFMFVCLLSNWPYDCCTCTLEIKN